MNKMGRGRTRMNADLSTLENQLRGAAQRFVYPPTPEMTARPASQRRHATAIFFPAPRVVRLAWLVAALVLLLGLWSVPTVRAGVLEWLQIGAVRIQLDEPTATVAPTGTPTGTPRPTAVPTATPVPLANILNLSGKTTLAAARDQLSIPIRLPSYPADLGKPERVFVQHVGGSGSFALLVWLDAQATESTAGVRLSLMQMEPDAFVTKGEPQTIAETTIHGRQALWTEGPYSLIHRKRHTVWERLIEGHVLIWTEQIDGQEITYRLETDWSLDEARRVAESLE